MFACLPLPLLGSSSVVVPSLPAVALVLDSLLYHPRGPIPDPDQSQSGEALSLSRRQSPALRAQSAAQRTESPSPSQPLQSRRRAGENDTRPSLRREGATGSSRSVGRQLRLAPALTVSPPERGRSRHSGRVARLTRHSLNAPVWGLLRASEHAPRAASRLEAAS